VLSGLSVLSVYSVVEPAPSVLSVYSVVEPALSGLSVYSVVSVVGLSCPLSVVAEWRWIRQN
jgi:hypothetical protein